MIAPLLRLRLRHARRWLGYAVAALLVAMALGAGAMSQLLPLAERHPDRIAAWLSARAGRPVAFDKVETEWTRRGPLLRLGGPGAGADGGQHAVQAADPLPGAQGPHSRSHDRHAVGHFSMERTPEIEFRRLFRMMTTTLS